MARAVFNSGGKFVNRVNTCPDCKRHKKLAIDNRCIKCQIRHKRLMDGLDVVEPVPVPDLLSSPRQLAFLGSDDYTVLAELRQAVAELDSWDAVDNFMEGVK